jgi:hypothetical protein
MKLNLGSINVELKKMPPAKIIFLTLLWFYILKRVSKAAIRIKKKGLLASIFRAATKLPIVCDLVAAEGNKTGDAYLKKYTAARSNTIKHLPEEGWTNE